MVEQTQKIIVKRIAIGLFSFILFVISISAILGSFYTVDAGDRGIIRRFGETIKVVEPGLGFKTPFVDDLIVISTREQKLQYGAFNKDGDVVSGIGAYTSDQQSVVVATTITFNVTDPVKVYNMFRGVGNMIDQIIEPRLRNQIEITMSQYNAKSVVEKRSMFAKSLEENFRAALKDYPVYIAGVQPVIQFSAEYEQQIADSVKKNVEFEKAEKDRMIAEKNAETTLVKKRAEAEAIIIESRSQAEKAKIEGDANAYTLKVNGEAEAYSLKIKGEAEAEAISAKAKALNGNPEIVKLSIAQQWNGQLPQTMTPNSALPILDLNQMMNKNEKVTDSK